MSSNSLPTRVKFFIADDIRADGPKPMIIGLFVDDFVGVVIPKEKPDPSKDSPIMLQSLAVLASFIGCEGKFGAQISLFQPDNTPIFEHQKIEGAINADPLTGKGNLNFLLKFMPFAIHQFGKYKFIFKLDDEEYEFNFNIGRGVAANV